MEPSDGFSVSWPILISVLLTSGASFVNSLLEECEKPDSPDWLFGTTPESATVKVAVKKTKKTKTKTKKRRKPKIKDPPVLTSAKVIEDAVMFLCCLGEKKRVVDPVVKDLSTKKKYEKVEDIVKDFYKHS